MHCNYASMQSAPINKPQDCYHTFLTALCAGYHHKISLTCGNEDLGRAAAPMVSTGASRDALINLIFSNCSLHLIGSQRILASFISTLYMCTTG